MATKDVELETNMTIWNQVCTSTPYQLKKVDLGRKWLSIDAYTQLERATQVFGAMGIGFGLNELAYNIVDTVKGTSKEPTAPCKYLLVQATFWYKFPGTTVIGQYPMLNGMELNAQSDAPKKVLTNIITKALSYLGFNFDVFKGSWDDDPYLNRPDIPAPSWLIENFKRLLGTEAFTEEQRVKLSQFQIDNGWTIQSVSNFVNDAPALLMKRGITVPELLTEKEDTDGVQQGREDGKTEESKEEKSP